MKKVTLNADELLISAARERALREGSTLGEQFRRWLTEYARAIPPQQYESAMIELRGKLVVGRRLTRDEMNQR